jgi:hypothetical protein
MTKLQEQVQVHDGRNDFDFLIGTWDSRQRRLRERLKGSGSWEEFPAKLEVRKVLGGLGNFDELVMERESGVMRGATLRLYDLNSHQWSIYWADGIHGTMGVPEVGGFKDGRGEFYAHEPFEGRMIFSRFIWTPISEDACRWEQAFSEDACQTWETNWVAHFIRC